MICNPIIGCFGTVIDGTTFFSRILSGLLSLLLTAGVVIFVFKFLSGAIKYITSGGNKDKIADAKRTLTESMIGITILLATFAVISFIECFFGIGLRSINVGLYNISFGTAPVCK